MKSMGRVRLSGEGGSFLVQRPVIKCINLQNLMYMDPGLMCNLQILC